MKTKIFLLKTLLLGIVLLMGGGNVWAATGTDKASNTGTKDTDLSGTCYTIAGTYVAGSGSVQGTKMANKGVKLRTGQDGNRIVFTVKSGYTINSFTLYGISNYALADGKSEPCISVTKVLVDGVETVSTGTNTFAAKSETSKEGSVILSNIAATESIAIYFDNTNAAGKQINAYYEIDWSNSASVPDPTPSEFDPSKLYVVNTYDFTAMPNTTLVTGSKVGDIWNEANSKNNAVYVCTNSGLEFLAIQAAMASKKGWTIENGANKGLLEGSGAGRCAAILGIKNGWYVEFYHTSVNSFYTKNDGEDNGIRKEEVFKEEGHIVFKAKEDGMLGFELVKGRYVNKVVIYTSDLADVAEANISKFKDLSAGTESYVTLTNAKVTAVNGTDVYMEDNTAGIKFVNSKNLSLAAGDVLNGILLLKRTTDGGTTIDATTLDGRVTKTAGTAMPTAATMDDAQTDAKQDMFLQLTGVSVTTDGDVCYVNQGGKSLKVLNTLFADATTTISGKKQLASIAGIVTADGIIPTKAADIVLGENVDKLPVAANIAAFKALADKEEAQLTLTDAFVTYNDGTHIYLQDASGAIAFDQTLADVAAGKKLNGTQSAKLSIADNGIEKLAVGTANNADSYAAADGTFVPVAFDNLALLKSTANLCNMVRVNRSSVSTVGGKQLLSSLSSTATIEIRDVLGTGVIIPENIAYITGIVLYDKDDYVLAPVSQDSIKEYFPIVDEYVVDAKEEGETLAAGDSKVLTGAIMTVSEDTPVTAENKVVGQGDSRKTFTAKIEGNNYTFEATLTGTLTVYTEKKDNQPVTVTENGETMKDFDAIAQKLDSIQIPVVAGNTYVLSTTESPLSLYGFTFDPNDKDALPYARNIALFKKLYDGLTAVEDTLALNNAVVTYIDGDDVFVEDESGAIDFYETKIQFYVGQHLNGYIVGKNKDKNKVPVLTYCLKTNEAGYTVEKGTAQSKPITIAEAQEQEGLARFVTLSDVKFGKDDQGFRVLTDAAGNSIRIEDHFNVFYELPEHIKSIEGIIGINAEGTHFFWPTSKEGVVEAAVPATFETGKYYIANVGADQAGKPANWGAGNDMGTRGSLLKHAEYVTLHAQGNGVYQMETQVSNGGTAYFFNGDYMDNGNPMNLTITRSKEPIGYSDDDETVPVYAYYIADGENYFGWDGETTVLGKNVAKASDNALWMIFSEEQMKAELATATTAEPVDATFLILDPNFGRNNRNVGAWTMEADNKNLSGGNNINNCAESWRSAFTLSQELTDIPNGKYVINAQAAITDYAELYDGADYPVIYANDKSAAFNNMETEDRATNMSTLSQAFSADKYQVEPLEVIVTDGKLTIGAKGTRLDTWAIWDNFELTYYGPVAAPVETVRTWDFTTWSATTVADLKADAAASKTSGWSDVEKKADAEADKEPTEASKDNCFWLAGAPNDNGELTANGKVISELKGLKFYSTYAGNRSLAIAVNYPETSLGTYAGPSYLWLGGGKNSLAVFTIPNVVAGSTITVEVESHKPTEGRGIELYTTVGDDQKVVADSKIGDTFAPTTKESHSWTVESDGDVIVYNTNGCHIYTLKVEAPQQKQFNVTYALAEGESHAAGEAVNIKDETGEELATLTFGDTGNEFKAAKANASVEGFTAFTEGNGTNGNADGGTYYFFKPKYDGKADFAVVLNADKAFYIEEDGTALADYNGIKVTEKKYGTFTCDVKGGSTYKVYCTGSKLGFYGVKYYNTDQIITSIQQAPAVRIADDAIYNLRGQKVTGTLKPGIYVKNGKKIVVK
ncbi:MAG: hypothetical protein IJ559_05155 [Prevotella sp.]|nr:hypothetical protein [Prevotella sp.]